jgi:ABC-type sugar transport system ATPase subunit
MIELKGISKSFPGVKSLDRVDFEARSGEVHALLGENGAGKSTLIKTIAGAYRPEEGTIRFDGQERVWSSPKEAADAGIHVVHQELVLFPDLSVAENVFLAHRPLTRWSLVDHKAMRERTAEALARLGHRLDPRMPVRNLSVADRQMVEIAKALVGEVRLLVLDEPTAVLSGREAELLFERVRKLRSEGVCVIYVSHRLDEIFALADRVTVLKDGRLVGTREVRDLDRDGLVAMMVGRELTDIYPAKRARSGPEPVLSVRHLSSPPRVRDVSFDLFPGEILGLGGLMGAGRSEVAHALFDSVLRASGEVLLDGRAFAPRSPRQAIQAGLAFLTEDRKAEGLLLNLDVAANVTAPTLSHYTRAGGLDRQAEARAAAEEIGRFRIAVPSPWHGVAGLSGGNQQKVLFARWSRVCGKVLILDEPTRGVDVGARAEIYEIVRQLAESGLGVLLISSDLPELIGLCDRVVVMREGATTGEVEGASVTEHAIMQLATAARAA